MAVFDKQREGPERPGGLVISYLESKLAGGVGCRADGGGPDGAAASQSDAQTAVCNNMRVC